MQTLPDVSFKRGIGLALKMRCPVCGEDRPFSKLFQMKDECGSCHFHYEREPGYFLGAMYFSYFMCVAILLPTVVLALLFKASILTAAILTLIQIVPLSPIIFRYSRGLWIAIDIVLSPIEPRELRG